MIVNSDALYFHSIYFFSNVQQAVFVQIQEYLQSLAVVMDIIQQLEPLNAKFANLAIIATVLRV